MLIDSREGWHGPHTTLAWAWGTGDVGSNADGLHDVGSDGGSDDGSPDNDDPDDDAGPDDDPDSDDDPDRHLHSDNIDQYACVEVLAAQQDIFQNADYVAVHVVFVASEFPAQVLQPGWSTQGPRPTGTRIIDTGYELELGALPPNGRIQSQSAEFSSLHMLAQKIFATVCGRFPASLMQCISLWVDSPHDGTRHNYTVNIWRGLPRCLRVVLSNAPGLQSSMVNALNINGDMPQNLERFEREDLVRCGIMDEATQNAVLRAIAELFYPY